MTPHIPTCRLLESDPIPDTYDDMVNPPGLTNFLGVAQVDHDVHAVRSISFPPYSQGDTITAQLYLDGRLARSYGGTVTHTWRPDRVHRRIRIGELIITTRTVLVPDEFAVLVRTEVTGPAGRTVDIGLALRSGITRSAEQWHSESPIEPNSLTWIGRTVVAAPTSSPAATAQAVSAPDAAFDGAGVRFGITLDGSGRAEFDFVQAVGPDADAARAVCTGVLASADRAEQSAEQRWDTALDGAFDPDSTEFTGSLPVLHTDNAALQRLYWWGIAGLIWFRRDNPASVLGRTYDTLSPRYWQTTTFIWDYSLSSLVHALLDPAVMRRHIEHWVNLDIHAHFGTSWLTGGPVGYWYSVNDFAMTRLVRDYVRCTGDRDFLTTSVGQGSNRRTVAEHVDQWAHAWEGLRRNHALADYGGIDNLLECVSSYVHEVAGLNAANVWCLRASAELAALLDRPEAVAGLHGEADRLWSEVQELYVAGKGFWGARQPDGRVTGVRHCYDFATIGTLLVDDLTATQRTEMVDFFVRELQSPTWMRALSPWDADAAYSLRPDHQWNGAYPAWPADSARALCRLGRPDLAAAWLPGLARSANQGPCGQAHFLPEAQPLVAGGARKAPPQFPYLIDWSCSSSGSWATMILEGVFGLEIGVDGQVSAAPALDGLDPAATLAGLRIQGHDYIVDASGAHRT